MSANNKTFQPLTYISMKAGEDFLPNRFIGFDGNICADEAKSVGVTDSKWIAGEMASVLAIGIAVIECSESINAGDLVTSDADGKAKNVAEGDEINGRALDSVTTSGFIRINLIP
jgi:hypothetical protein